MSGLVYLASPLGFTPAGQLWAAQVLLPAVAAAGLTPLDPWAPSPAVDQVLRALALPDGFERTAALARADDAVAAANVALIDRADCLLANLDGADVDSGTASEVGYAGGRRIPIVGLRQDLRLAGDNAGVTVNLQVTHFINRDGGAVFHDLAAALDRLATLLSRRPRTANGGAQR